VSGSLSTLPAKRSATWLPNARDACVALRVFAGAKHTHEAQQPQLLELK